MEESVASGARKAPVGSIAVDACCLLSFLAFLCTGHDEPLVVGRDNDPSANESEANIESYGDVRSMHVFLSRIVQHTASTYASS